MTATTHYQVVRGATTVGYALSKGESLWFTPAGKVNSKLAEELHLGLLGMCPLPKNTRLVAWRPEPTPASAAAAAEGYDW